MKFRIFENLENIKDSEILEFQEIKKQDKRNDEEQERIRKELDKRKSLKYTLGTDSKKHLPKEIDLSKVSE